MKESIKAFILITLILMIGGIISAIYFNEPAILVAFGLVWLLSPIIIDGLLKNK